MMCHDSNEKLITVPISEHIDECHHRCNVIEMMEEGCRYGRMSDHGGSSELPRPETTITFPKVVQECQNLEALNFLRTQISKSTGFEQQLFYYGSNIPAMVSQRKRA